MQSGVGMRIVRAVSHWTNGRTALLALLCIPTLALAQTNLEDLQRQVDQAMQKKAAQDKPPPAKKTVDSPAPTRAAVGRQSTLVSDSWRDSRSGLIWSLSDNGYGYVDINWKDARSWCAGKGSGWDLPTMTALQSIYDKDASPEKCGGGSCRVVAPFKLTGPWVWTRETDGPMKAYAVDLGFGIVNSFDVGYSAKVCALCVRRS